MMAQGCVCVRVHGFVHINMSVFDYLGPDWDARDENLSQVMDDMFHTVHMFTVHNTIAY